MERDRLTGAKRRVLERLKRTGRATAGDLARSLGLTAVAIRQHLLALERGRLVTSSTPAPAGRGRPSIVWSLTPLANEVFPDRHSDLTVDLISAARAAFGEEGLERIVAQRARQQTRAYRDRLARAPALKDKVKALAAQRTAEGYMAEMRRDPDGGYLLVEHHCPICEAATSCTGLCSAELEVFQKSLGRGVRVERSEHLLSDGDRCVYRIRPARGSRPSARK